MSHAKIEFVEGGPTTLLELDPQRAISLASKSVTVIDQAVANGSHEPDDRLGNDPDEEVRAQVNYLSQFIYQCKEHNVSYPSTLEDAITRGNEFLAQS